MSRLAGSSYLSGMKLFFFFMLVLFSAVTESAAPSLVESVRKDGILTILSPEAPIQKKYEIGEPHGTAVILQTIPCKDRTGYYYRSIVRFEGDSVPKIGDSILLKEYTSHPAVSYIGERSGKSFIRYKKEIRSRIDRREMVLIPAGRFYMGNDAGDPDESPKRIEHLESYYIDKYEVSNADYLVFVKERNAAMPRSWGGVFPDQLSGYPVVVSYREAVSYCLWSEKNLPSEAEWEKAANGSRSMLPIRHPDGYYEVLEKTLYPWGNSFDSVRTNSLDFMMSSRGIDLVSRKIMKQYLPVSFGGTDFSSAFGVYHMSGNAQEWTDSWYDAYPGNRKKDYRFGMKYKVIRGGAWYSSKDRVRLTSREIGGTPNLDEDVIAGFRCVKALSPDDILE